MLADINGNAASRLFADNPSRIRLIMKVTEARQMTYITSPKTSTSGSWAETTLQQGCIALNGLQHGVYAVQFGTLGSTLIRK